MQNRWGHKLTKGQKVLVTLARGGTSTEVIARFETKGAYAEAYGPRVICRSGRNASLDDCRPMQSLTIPPAPWFVRWVKSAGPQQTLTIEHESGNVRSVLATVNGEQIAEEHGRAPDIALLLANAPLLLAFARTLRDAMNASDATHETFRDSGADVVEILWQTFTAADVRALVDQFDSLT